MFLNTAGKKQWKERGKKEVVVLVDEGSTAQGLGESLDSTPILALKDALTKVRGVGVRCCVSWNRKLIICDLLDCCCDSRDCLSITRITVRSSAGFS